MRLASITILISDKTGFKIKLIIRDKRGHFIPIKATIRQKDIIILNICVVHNFIKKQTNKLLLDLKTKISINP